MNFRRQKHRARLKFFISGMLRYLLPSWPCRRHFERQLAELTPEKRAYIDDRVNYYLRLPRGARLPEGVGVRLRDFRFPWRAKNRHSAYFLDLYEAVCIGRPDDRFAYIFGDLTEEAPYPAFVKSRPITDGPTNSVLLKLNSVRHYQFVRDELTWEQKEPRVVFRAEVHQPHRREFLRRWFGHPLVNAGQINSDEAEDPRWVQPFMPVEEQLRYKFVATIEGNDVATSLKWVMGSNSLALMPRPRIESWFMEGRLEPGVHYVEVRPTIPTWRRRFNTTSSIPRRRRPSLKTRTPGSSNFRTSKGSG